MRCPSCQAENQATRQFCRECGAPLGLVCGHCRFTNEPADRFCGGCGRPLSAPVPAPARAVPDAGQALAAERRQITLVFIDLVGSTALTERLDPEDMGDLYHAYRAAAGTIIEGYGGCVAQFVGDGILAYFGYPQAQEDDAVRAVRAALEIGPAVRNVGGAWNRDGRIDLDIRAGVHTGVVVVGAQGVGPLVDPLAVVGGPANVAARIQNYAPPGAVMVTGATWRLIEGRFECEDLGRHPMRGVRETVHILRVRRPSDAVTRFEAATALTDLVGREAELELILEDWECAKAGGGRLVQLRGEPGIGKSRLVRGVTERLAGQPHRVLRCQCSPFTLQSTLQPVVSGLQRAAGFLPDDGPDERLDKLEAFLAAGGQPVRHVAPLYAALLSLPFEPRYGTLDLTPARQKELTLAAVIDQIVGLAKRQPVLLVVEDAHWIDPTSQEFLDGLVRELPAGRLLLLVTARPEYAHDWPCPSGRTIEVGRLPEAASRALVGRIAGPRMLPPEIVSLIIGKTEGIPLFVEELTRTILESGDLLEVDGRLELRGSLPSLGIPATLQESLLARLDRLGPAKEVAQIAAAVGREFSHRLLAEVAALPSTALEEALARLSEADLVTRNASPAPSYAFRHALIRDIAYGSLLRPKRQELHARIARSLPRTDPELSGTQPELLAYHLTEAGEHDEAVDWWLKAGQRATALSANREAVDHLSRGLDLLDQLPDDERHRQRRLQLLVSRGPAQIVLRGAASPEVEQDYAQALRLTGQLPMSQQHFAAHWGWWFISPDYREQRRRGAHLIELAERTGDDGLLMQAHHCQWATQLNLGNLQECRGHIATGLALYEAGAYGDEVALYGGHDAKVCGLGNAGIVAWLLGDAEGAQRHITEVLAWAPLTGHAASRAHALKGTCHVGFFSRDYAGLRRTAEELVDLAEAHDFAGYHAEATIFLGWVAARQGELDRGLDLVRDGIARFRAVSTGADSPFFANIHAELLGMSGAYDEALIELDQAMGDMQGTALQLWLPELQRCYGELLARRGGAVAKDAQSWVERAIATAQAQSAGALLERARGTLQRIARPDR